MILKSLTLKNFRKFDHQIIEFPDGITGVVGLNGAGKSTIFEAIAWALYGSVAARTSAEQIKRESADHKEPCRVELEFIFENDTYRIVREMTGKNLVVSASVLVNGKLAANSAEIVSKYMQKKLGMDFKSFFTSIFARQKELNMLSVMNASERRPLILKMLGIDALDEVIKEIRSDKKHKDALIEKLRSDLVDKTGKGKVEIYKEEIKQQEKKQKELILIIQQSRDKIAVFKKELSQLEKNVLTNKNEYEKINKRKEQLADKKTLFDKSKELKDEIEKLHSKIEERERNIKEEQKKAKGFEKIEQDSKTAEQKLSDAAKKSENFVKKIEQKKTIVDGRKEHIKEIESKKKEIEKLGPDATCPTCERILADQYTSLIDKFDKEKKQKNSEIESLLKEIKTEQEEYEKLSREEQALQKKMKYLQSQLREKERIETTIANISKELEQEKKEKEGKEKQLKKIGPVKFDPKEYDTVKKQVDEFYSKYQSSLTLLNDKKEQIVDENLRRERTEGEKKLILEQVKNLKDKIREQESFKKQIEKETKTLQHLSMLSDVMSSFRIHLISRIRPTLSSYASDFFERLTDGKYQQIEIDENYNLMVYDEGESYNIERFSGGEEDLANLCLRLAISEVITERAGGIFNFIILDEIFGSQDMIRRQNIMKALNSLSSKFRQIFLITHVEDVKHFMEHTMAVSEDERGISTIKIE